MKQHRKYLDDVVREYSINSFPGILRGLRKYSLTALAVGAIGIGSFLGGCATDKEKPEPTPQITYNEPSARKDLEEKMQSYEQTKITFMSDRNGKYEIYVMDADGSNQINLTNNPAGDGNPSWSPFLEEGEKK